MRYQFYSVAWMRPPVVVEVGDGTQGTADVSGQGQVRVGSGR